MKNIFEKLRGKKPLKSILVIFIGWLLSPFTWWNDTFINIPISYLFASVIAVFFQKIFLPAFLLFYWLTNIAGIIMMGEGAKSILTEGKIAKHRYLIYAITTLVYSVIAVVLVYIGIIKPIKFSAVAQLFSK